MGNKCVKTKNKGNIDIKASSAVQLAQQLNKLTQPQLQLIKNLYQKHKTQEGIDLETFKKLTPKFSEMSPQQIKSVFTIFDKQGKGVLSYQCLCSAVAKYTHGTRKQKCQFLYWLFSPSNSKYNRESIKKLTDFCRQFLKPEKTINDLIQYQRTKKPLIFQFFHQWAIANLNMRDILIDFQIIPSPITQRRTIRKLIQETPSKRLVKGQYWNLINKNWFEAWKKYTQSDLQTTNPNINPLWVSQMYTSLRPDQRPIQIDNSNLADSQNPLLLKQGLIQEQDYILIPLLAWQKLFQWYGGGPEFKRKVISNPQITLELYPPVLQIITVINNKAKTILKPLSNFYSSKQIIEQYSTSYSKNLSLYIQQNGKFTEIEQDLLVQDLYTKGVQNLILSDKTPTKGWLNDVKLDNFNQGDAVQYKLKGVWIPLIVKQKNLKSLILGTSWNKKQVQVPNTLFQNIRKPPRILLKPPSKFKGLLNQGNTCYLNSVVQCFKHFPLLSDFFSQQIYTRNINSKNPLGSQGRICKQFGELIKTLKTTGARFAKAESLLVQFAKIHSDFRGNFQQDSHQFLRLLLDSLHQDLSRSTDPSQLVLNSVSIENPTPQQEIQTSKKLWQEIQGNIGSVITDFCGGQNKRTVCCTGCRCKKVIFEAMLDMSVPIPIEQNQGCLIFTFMPRLSSSIKKLKFLLSAQSNLEEVLEKIKKNLKVPLKSLIFGLVRQSCIKKLVTPLSLQDLIPKKNQQIYIFQIISSITEGETDGKITHMQKLSPNWRSSLKGKQQIDFWHEKTGWVPALIQRVRGSQLSISPQFQFGRQVIIQMSDDTVAPFRYHTRNLNGIIIIPLSNIYKRGQDLQFFGNPCLISIGNWYTWRDLIFMVVKTCSLFTFKGSNPELIKRNLSIFVYKEKSKECGLCEQSGCKGCQLPFKNESIQWLYQNMNQLFLCACWKNPQYYFVSFPKIAEELRDFDLMNCFQQFVKQETIEFTCQKCQNTQHKSISQIWRAPDILIVHLKRFQMIKGKACKIQNLVNFPLRGLDISGHMDSVNSKKGFTVSNSIDNYKYDLFAVINHTGSPSGGHYTSFCYEPQQDIWLEYDDQRVYKVTGDQETEIVTAKAYILFYRRRRFAASNHLNMSDSILF